MAEILVLDPEFDLEQAITFRTDITEFETGKEQRKALWDYGLRDYNLSLRWYTETAMNVIWDFYIARKGAYGNFWVKVPTEYSIISESIGTGDGKETVFLLDEFPVDTAANFTLYVNGSSTAGTLSNNTVTEKSYATFSAPPAAATALTASYEFYFRMRFLEDALSRKLMSYKLLHSDLKLKEDRWPAGYHPRAGNS